MKAPVVSVRLRGRRCCEVERLDKLPVVNRMAGRSSPLERDDQHRNKSAQQSCRQAAELTQPPEKAGRPSCCNIPTGRPAITERWCISGIAAPRRLCRLRRAAGLGRPGVVITRLTAGRSSRSPPADLRDGPRVGRASRSDARQSGDAAVAGLVRQRAVLVAGAKPSPRAGVEINLA